MTPSIGGESQQQFTNFMKKAMKRKTKTSTSITAMKNHVSEFPKNEEIISVIFPG